MKIYTITSLVYFSHEICSHLQIHEAHMWKSANILGELPADGGGAAEGLAQPAARPMAAGCSGQSQSFYIRILWAKKDLGLDSTSP